MPPELSTLLTQDLYTSYAGRISAPNVPEQLQITPTFIGAPAAEAAEEVENWMTPTASTVAAALTQRQNFCPSFMLLKPPFNSPEVQM